MQAILNSYLVAVSLHDCKDVSSAKQLQSAHLSPSSKVTNLGIAALQILNLRDVDSDEDAAVPDQAQQQQTPASRAPQSQGSGACVLPAFQPVVAATKNKKGTLKDEEAACAVCGDGDQAEK